LREIASAEAPTPRTSAKQKIIEERIQKSAPQSKLPIQISSRCPDPDSFTVKTVLLVTLAALLNQAVGDNSCPQ
jgi:hypothetical protein